MKSFKMLLTIGCVLGMTAAAAPAFAQHRGGGGGHASGGRGGAAVNRGGGVQGGGSAVPRGPVARGPVATARGYGGYGTYRGYGYPAYRTYAPYRGYGYGAYGGYRVIAPLRYLSPYYAFRPRLSVGFGIWAGYPIAFSYGFYDPFFYDGYPYYGGYPYPYTYSYPYPPVPPAYGSSYPQQGYPSYAPQAYPPSTYGSPSSTYPPSNRSTYPPAGQGSVDVQPGQEHMGGLSFDITPATAQVFIDGRLAGTVGEFSPTSQPLGVQAGRHHLEVSAEGYDTLTLDIDIVAGQVIPYQGSLQRR